MTINKIENENVGKRLDIYLQELNPDHTRSFFKNLIDDEKILVNDKKVKAGYNLRLGDMVSIDELPKPLTTAEAEDIKLDIVYQDQDFAVINKPQGMVVHPAVKNTTGTLVNALLFNIKDLSGINGVLRPGIVHRLDKDTSGLIVIAKNDFAHTNLANQISTKTCRRIYRCIVNGLVKESSGEIVTNIGRDPKNRLKMAVVPKDLGKVAISQYRVLDYFKGYTYMEWELKTGRTHQIRVHSTYLKNPIVGDKLYNPLKPKFSLNGQLLHAYKLVLNHPRTGELMEFTAELPDYFTKVLNSLEKV